MRRRERIYPPNCTVCDLSPSRFLAFRAKQNEVEAEYGFRLCVPRRTPEQQDGYRRYMRDYRRRYQEAHREERKAYRHAYWVNVTKRGFDNLAEATGDEETLKRRAAKKVAKQKRAEFDERKRQIHEQYGFWLNTPPKTPDEAAGRARYRKEQDAARKERNRDKEVETRLAAMHESTREKGRSTRRRYFLENTVTRFAERIGWPRQRVMARFLDDGVVDWLMRSVDNVKSQRSREASSLLAGRISDAVNALEFYYRAVESMGNGGGA